MCRLLGHFCFSLLLLIPAHTLSSVSPLDDLTLSKISKNHIDCHLAMHEMIKYLPHGAQCQTKTRNNSNVFNEQSIHTENGIEYECSRIEPDQSVFILNGSECQKAAADKKAFFRVLDGVNNTSLYPSIEPTPDLVPPPSSEPENYLLLIALQAVDMTKNAAVSTGYAAGNLVELYYHLFRKPFKLIRRYSVSVGTMMPMGIKIHNRPASKGTFIIVFDSIKLLFLLAWNFFEIFKHSIHALNYNYDHEFSETETSLELGSASYELYEEGGDALKAANALRQGSFTLDGFQDVGLYLLILYNGSQAIQGMNENSSLGSFFYNLTVSPLHYLLGIPSSNFQGNALSTTLFPAAGTSPAHPVELQTPISAHSFSKNLRE